MKIGIDLDGVIFDSEKDYRVYSELYDLLDLHKNSKKDNREIKFQQRFDWNEEEINGFIKKYHSKITVESNFMPGVKTVLPMIKNDGNKLYLITARGRINKEMIPITLQRLEKNGLDVFEKYYWATENKEDICKKENIDIMIDDSYQKCKNVANAHIQTIYLKDAPSYDLEENEYIHILYNWGEIYRYLFEMQHTINSKNSNIQNQV